ncbi:MAG: hypothetical protein DHS20C16_02180 [Phycisphaerae bacterium]|nr:MAG: hypothetical protein DHS20C16_02180 [Phycisphaerae bacterium]
MQRLPTINITRGCSFGCVYCYIQGYPNYPGDNKIVVYENTAELVKNELERKRTKPSRVYFSSSSDAFQNDSAVLDVAFETMRVILSNGVKVAFLTKGAVGDRFIKLFQEHAGQVCAQVGITSLDDRILTALEPSAASAKDRIDSMRRLIGAGVQTSARFDPLIPELTDTNDSFSSLLEELSRIGVRSAAASYLFLRPAFARKTMAAISSLLPTFGADKWRRQQFKNNCGGGKMIDETERERRFNRLRTLGKTFGVAVRVCGCKNPEHTSGECGIAGPPPANRERDAVVQIPLFAARS